MSVGNTNDLREANATFTKCRPGAIESMEIEVKHDPMPADPPAQKPSVKRGAPRSRGRECRGRVKKQGSARNTADCSRPPKIQHGVDARGRVAHSRGGRGGTTAGARRELQKLLQTRKR